MFHPDCHSFLSQFFIASAASIIIAAAAIYGQKAFNVFAVPSDNTAGDSVVRDKDGRIVWIDLAKGIGMLLVISGHYLMDMLKVAPETYSVRIAHGIIYAFHMPLFMILSCVAYRLSADNDQFVTKLEKTFKHLIIPFILIFLFKTADDLLLRFNALSFNDLRDSINTIIYSSGVDVDFQNIKINQIGFIWFLPVLACGRTLFDYLHLKFKDKEKIILFIVSLCSIVGIIMGQIQWLPLSLDISLAVMPFFLIGLYIQKLNLSAKKNSGFLCSLITCICGLIFVYNTVGNQTFSDYLNLADRYYNLFPLCYIIATAGSLTVFYLSQMLLSLNHHPKLLIFLGKHSMCLFFIHYMDYMYKFIWSNGPNDLINFLLRLGTDILLCILIVKTTELIKTRKQTTS